MSEKSIVFDLDDTICYPNHDEKDTYRKYGLARPNVPLIKKMHELNRMGYRIKLLSARRMLTHNGDIGKIIEDVGKITLDWLEQFNVPFHEIEFGKPYASSYYVDDKAMTPEEFLHHEF